MTDRSTILSRISERLILSQPARARVLLEIAGDLEDLHRHYVSEGRTDAEAWSEAALRIEVSPEALQELTQIHDAPLRRVMDGLSEQARTRWERAGLGLLVLFTLLVMAGLMVSEGFFAHVRLTGWVVVILAVPVLFFSVRRAFALYFGRPGDLRKIGRGVSLILAVAVVQAVLGLGGVWLELYRTARRIQTQPDGALVLLINWAVDGSATVMVALTAAIGSALVWFVLARRVARIREAEAAALLTGGLTGVEGPG